MLSSGLSPFTPNPGTQPPPHPRSVFHPPYHEPLTITFAGQWVTPTGSLPIGPTLFPRAPPERNLFLWHPPTPAAHHYTRLPFHPPPGSAKTDPFPLARFGSHEVGVPI